MKQRFEHTLIQGTIEESWARVESMEKDGWEVCGVNIMDRVAKCMTYVLKRPVNG